MYIMNTARDLTQIFEAPHVLNNVVMIDNLQLHKLFARFKIRIKPCKGKIDRCLTGSDPRNNCGIHFGSSPLLVSKVANKKFYQLRQLLHTIYHHTQIEKLTVSGASSSSERISSVFLSTFPFVYIQMNFSAAIETVETF